MSPLTAEAATAAPAVMSTTFAAAMKSFFTSLTSYLHRHDGGKPVMTSPTYEHLTESPAQVAASVKSVLGGFDVLDGQDSGGSGMAAVGAGSRPRRRPSATRRTAAPG